MNAQELQAKIAAAQRYINNMAARGETRFVEGGTRKLNEYQAQLADLANVPEKENLPATVGQDEVVKENLPATVVDEGVKQNLVETEPAPPKTGNVAVDQSNVLSSILNSPLYTEEIKGAYLTQYLPGLTQANYDINAARASEVQNAQLRSQAQADAIRQIAGSYAARGMRTPKMVTEGFAPVQQATKMQKDAAEQAIAGLIANKELQYGAGAKDKETFMSDPTKFGAIGAGARRTALGNLQQLPQQYGLTQVEKAPTSPLVAPEPVAEPAPVNAPVEPVAEPAPTVTTPASGGMTKEQLQAKITAAQRYIKNMAAKGETKFVEGGTRKLSEYENALKALG